MAWEIACWIENVLPVRNINSEMEPWVEKEAGFSQSSIKAFGKLARAHSVPILCWEWCSHRPSGGLQNEGRLAFLPQGVCCLNLDTTPTGTNEVIIQTQDKTQRCWEQISSWGEGGGAALVWAGLRKGTWRGNIGSQLRSKVYIPVSILARIYCVTWDKPFHLSESQIHHVLNSGGWSDGF